MSIVQFYQYAANQNTPYVPHDGTSNSAMNINAKEPLAVSLKTMTYG
jgi:hypothetical protein